MMKKFVKSALVLLVLSLNVANFGGSSTNEMSTQDIWLIGGE